MRAVFLVVTGLLFTAELCAQIPRFISSTTYTPGPSLSSVAAGDFNADGRTDLVVVANPNGSATDTIHVLLANANGTFSAAAATGGTANLSSVATGDFDGDGKLDIVVTDSQLRRATVLLGNGDGTFSAAGSCLTDTAPVEVVVADLDGDGNLDIGVANAGDGSIPGTVSVCLGGGDGTLGPKLSYSAASGGIPADPVGIAVADFDGDKKLDFAVALHSNAYSILRGNGDGTFQTPLTRFLFNTPNPRAIAAGDLNGDGLADVAITTGTVQVLLGNGDTTFQPPVTYSTGTSTGIAIADLNGDGQPDLVVSNDFRHNFSVLLNLGGGLYSSPVDYAAELFPGPIVIGDFEGNAMPGVAVVNLGTSPVFPSSLTVALGNGNGTFNAGVSYLANTPGEISSLDKLATGDIGGSGLLDLAVIAGDGTVHVLLQNPDSTYRPAIRVSPGIFPSDIALADLNHDGKPDLIVAGFNGYSILLGNGDGTFQSPLIHPLASNGSRSLAVADLNNDGNPDLLISSPTGSGNSIGILFGNGDGTFQTAVTYALGGLPEKIVVADLNQDAVADVAVATFGGGSTFSPGAANVLIGNGDGTFQPALLYSTGVGSVDLAAVDVNGDGFPDLAVVNGGNGTAANASLSMLLNNGDGTFQPSVQYSTGTMLNHVAVGDFNNDGASDVALTSFRANSVFLFENANDATGRLSDTPGKYAAGASPGSIAAGPFSGGYAPDLAIANGNGETVTILRNNSSSAANGAMRQATPYIRKH